MKAFISRRNSSLEVFGGGHFKLKKYIKGRRE
jgi:hypothetical protein